jgi:hypothetical protein
MSPDKMTKNYELSIQKKKTFRTSKKMRKVCYVKSMTGLLGIILDYLDNIK